MTWIAVLTGSIACYVLKLAGLSVPERVLRNVRVQRIALLLPVALLTALVVIQTFTTGHRLVIDARSAGLVAAVVAIVLRAPFLVVVALACVTTAVVRLLA